MKLIISFATLIIVIAFTSFDPAQLLTNGSSKTWYLYSETPDSTEPSCKPSSSVMSDNTYIFFADGSFEFDHGTVTEDTECTSDDCCNDFVNIVGNWRFANSQKGLVVTALYEKGKPDHAETMVILSATIIQFDQSILKLSQKDPQSGIAVIYEFRAK